MSRVDFLTYEIYISQVGDILKLSTSEQAVDKVDFLTYELYITSCQPLKTIIYFWLDGIRHIIINLPFV